MTVRWFFAVALLVVSAAATANADEPPTRVQIARLGFRESL